VRLLGEVRGLGDRIAAREAEDPDRYPDESVRDLIALGALSMPLPVDLGGLGASLADAVELILAIAEASPSLALLMSMPVGLAGVLAGAGAAVREPARAAFADQVARVAEEYRAGRIFAACNSEKGAGGAIAATKTSARRAADGDLYVTGEKILASFGQHADVFFSSVRLPEGGVEIVFVDTKASGVEIRSDWDGFGMRSTESHSVRYAGAKARELLGYPGFLEDVQPFSWWWCLFGAIPLGCAASMLRALGDPAPASPAVRLRLSEALMRFEAARAYLLETARAWRPGEGAAYRGRVTRAKTFAAEESVRICADLFALSGGRHFTRSSRVARSMADSFAGAALRPPLPLALDALIENFSLGSLESDPRLQP
jgi:alkylation response protein AidB-like acyl-CoA dehydrogenase